ncbi:hypothetical protein FPOAC1_003473 [Fusarium poae]|uniref:hypothetical protein n=1 Tax=Fusarium poae TaxID=36050 RepID=UPI001CEB6B8D|nr:hypothetical protein FPOAC1_003473 [Fusarium poae]KAG8677455.1 hypothetical protein FPOAC1_003473 [Fusarium poae]
MALVECQPGPAVLTKTVKRTLHDRQSLQSGKRPGRSSSEGPPSYTMCDRAPQGLAGMSIHNLSRRIRKPIPPYKTCCLGQTNRQKRIGNYTPIRPPTRPMHTIAMDFRNDAQLNSCNMLFTVA